MKLAPLGRALAAHSTLSHIVVHTGQHYDREMSSSFFDDLGIPPPDVNLGVGTDTHARQTAAIMVGLEPILLARRPSLVLVYGDVNSTVAAALVAAKLGLPIAHIEAGLRSGDWSMPEEINRLVTDRLASLLFTPSRDADENLRREGVPQERIHFVGNIMIDTLVAMLPAARSCNAPVRFGVEGRRFVLVTLHRPSNVDDPERLHGLMGALATLSDVLPVLFPAHPRTSARLKAMGYQGRAGIRMLEPIPYRDMLSLTIRASLVVTDSGGLQEETSYLGVPCLTVRPNTERPVTCDEGTNRLVPNPSSLLSAARHALGTPGQHRPCQIEGWDGCAAERIVKVLQERVR
jgi:UDP-N-acetylglucosamine 2-epimerase (non-hydrolysing)